MKSFGFEVFLVGIIFLIIRLLNCNIQKSVHMINEEFSKLPDSEPISVTTTDTKKLKITSSP